MKRSLINAVIRRFEGMINDHRISLPPFLGWTPREWAAKCHEYDEIRENKLGWDVTDYGQGRFEELGIALVTLRNGNANNRHYRKSYAEKLIMIEEGQLSPMHFHWNKTEDIINRGGGNVIFKLYHATPDGQLADTEVDIHQDGRHYRAPAGSRVTLQPGASLTLYPCHYHEYVVEAGTGPVLLGEVSTCNDDDTDNRFLGELGRFPSIEEDEPPYRLLCYEYPAAAAGMVTAAGD